MQNCGQPRRGDGLVSRDIHLGRVEMSKEKNFDERWRSLPRRKREVMLYVTHV
jgi:hypothetical protein